MSYAMIFPGQGSQFVGMLSDIAAQHSLVEATFSTASQVLGEDLWSVVQQGPEAMLNQTTYTQPALLVASVALWRVWESLEKPRPHWLAGHSLGEYSALVVAGSITLEEAVGLVRARAQCMQEASDRQDGAMAAVIGLEDHVVLEACEQASRSDAVVEVANYNAVGQVVISGQSTALAQATDLCRQRGAKRVLELPVSVASHSSLMRPAATMMRAKLAEVDFQLPQIPVIHNVSLSVAQTVDDIRQALEKQLYSSVRWVETICYLRAQGVTTMVELGPGKVLCGLSKRIDKTITCLPAGDLTSFMAALRKDEETS